MNIRYDTRLNDVKSAFDRYALQFGSPLHLPIPDATDPDRDVLPIPFFELNQSAQSFAGTKNGVGNEFRPFVGVVSDGVANAHSAYAESCHFAVFGLTFCIELYMHFQALLSHPHVFSGIGDASRDKIRVAWNNRSDGTQLLVVDELTSTNSFGPTSIDQTRHMLGVRLYFWAMRFIGFHEIVHLALGHVHLLSSAIADDAAEFATKHTIVRRALEQHADLHALRRMATVAFLDAERPGAGPDDLTLMVFEMTYAMIAVMRMWSRGSPFKRDAELQNYPHPAVRYGGLHKALTTQFADLKLSETDNQAWQRGIALGVIETVLDDEILGCEAKFSDWLDSSELLIGEFERINREFVTENVSQQLRDCTFTDWYDGLLSRS